ncbi:UDP-glucose 4-epimerase GalE [Desulfobacterales bacterium HSG16]|nr:UDP-glucose 4-epimerase GalE [Desulfobacterales bacterium HSG16]
MADNKKNILVVGGAGYIGSYMCKCLSKEGYTPIVLDNLIYGHRQAVKWGKFYQGNLDDTDLLDKIFTEQPIFAVFHFAAYCYVGESVEKPGIYYENNVAATLRLLQSMIDHDVRKFIFSSSCAIFGEPVQIPISETHPKNPINPYGRTKLMVEQIADDFSHAHGLEHVCLRYFNAAGADPDGELGEDHQPETHLIPLVLDAALGKRPSIQIFGDDYPTEDGTCIRDYIHIEDLAQAHLLALQKLAEGRGGGKYNLGNGKGYSVMEVIETAKKISGRKILCQMVERRAGDPARLVGASQKAKEELGWKPKFTELSDIIETAWNWHRQHPDGYK